jgi:hypothetical protein
MDKASSQDFVAKAVDVSVWQQKDRSSKSQIVERTLHTKAAFVAEGFDRP